MFVKSADISRINKLADVSDIWASMSDIREKSTDIFKHSSFASEIMMFP